MILFSSFYFVPEWTTPKSEIGAVNTLLMLYQQGNGSNGIQQFAIINFLYYLFWFSESKWDLYILLTVTRTEYRFQQHTN